MDDPVTTTIDVTQGFTNSDPVDCPIEYTIVKEDKTLLDGGLENAFSINGSGIIIINQEHYPGGQLNLFIRARTGFNEPTYKSFLVTQLSCDL